jgi:Flp pilus assembly pilin Flp
MFKTLWDGKEKGQGLVEYALILVLIAIIVIAVLLLMGPRVGGIFSKVNTSLSGVGSGQSASLPTATPVPPTATLVPPSATPVPQWTNCAVENSFCSFSGTAQVRYGANGIWAYGTFSNGVQCSNATFGDPVFGVLKSCQVYQ